jgi:hypothetical protein
VGRANPVNGHPCQFQNSSGRRLINKSCNARALKVLKI